MNEKKQKLAIIGSGISGLSSAYFLKDHFEITLFEKNSKIGGHTNTIEEKGLKFDTGFMVFNEITYPNFTNFLKKLNVKYENTSMSFSVQHRGSGLEYSGSGFSGLFSQKKNIFNLQFLKMLNDINRFNKKSLSLVELNKGLTIGELCQKLNLGTDFYEKYLVPMSSAVWSASVEKMDKFPAKFLVQFFANHGFMGLNTQHQWKTVIGGSQNYILKLKEQMTRDILVNEEVLEVGLNVVAGQKNKWVIKTKKNQYIDFDKIVFACHADETYRLLLNKSSLEEELLSKFQYQKNIAIVHQDEKVMPQKRSVWSSWNSVTPIGAKGNLAGKSFNVYYMNMLQKLNSKELIFININGEEFVQKDKVLKKIEYSHPIFNLETEIAQNKILKLNRQFEGSVKRELYFCGSYFKYGFHEDGIWSSKMMSQDILGHEITL